MIIIVIIVAVVLIIMIIIIIIITVVGSKMKALVRESRRVPQVPANGTLRLLVAPQLAC